MKTSGKRSKSRFASAWDEMGYLYYKILRWFYKAPWSRAKAAPYARRLEHLLESTPGASQAIRGQEYWSLVCEIQGDLVGAIKHRKKEIALWRKLFSLPDYSSGIAGLGDYSDLADRLILLALLCQRAGRRRAAMKYASEAESIGRGSFRRLNFS